MTFRAVRDLADNRLFGVALIKKRPFFSNQGFDKGQIPLIDVINRSKHVRDLFSFGEAVFSSGGIKAALQGVFRAVAQLTVNQSIHRIDIEAFIIGKRIGSRLLFRITAPNDKIGQEQVPLSAAADKSVGCQ